jgi:putative phage-type endonuclease
MNFTIIEAEQRSEDWFKARAGRITGSKAECILAKGKGGAEAVTRRDYRAQLACERITGIPDLGGYINADMQRGIDLEPEALSAYEAKTGEIVRQTGFLQHNSYLAGCSLDGDIDDFRGIVEVKCPRSAIHLSYWREPSVFERQYAAQVMHNLWITGAEYCDLVSYDNRVPASLRVFRRRVQASTMFIPEYEKDALRFLAEVTIEEREIRELAAKAAIVTAEAA